jgi:signal transduction histidine kinase
MWVEAVGTPVESRGPHPVKIITTTRDASERKRAEAESQRYQENLLRINDELDQFAYVVSHDLKAPLRGISNLATFIREDIEEMGGDGVDAPVLPEEVSNHLKLMQSRVAQMEQFIEDVLAFSRAGRVGNDWVEIDMLALLQRIVENLSLPKSFKVELPEVLPPISGAKVHLEQVFSNLISNAWKHHHQENGLIRVRYAEDGDYHVFSVSDDGPGIPDQYHEKIFEVFQQLQPRDKLGGTGVGLAIVRKIVRSAGGHIKIVSPAAGGTEFNIYWPRQQQENPDS